VTSQFHVAAIIPAAGSGTRLQSHLGQSKQFALLHGKPLLTYTLQRFEECGIIDTLVIPTREEYISTVFEEIINPFGISGDIKVIPGGATRQESVWRGMQSLLEESPDIVIEQSVEVAQEHGGGVVGVPAVDTIKMSHGTRVEATVDRSILWYAQTPQTFRYELLYRAFQHANESGFVGTDEAMLVENLGETVMMIPGSKLNIKITDPDDLEIALALLDYRDRSHE